MAEVDVASDRGTTSYQQRLHEVLARGLPKKYGLVETFNHAYGVKHAPKSFLTTREIGAGLGEHLNYEVLSAKQKSGYYALELKGVINTLEYLVANPWPFEART